MRLSSILVLAGLAAASKPTVYFIRHGEKPSDGGDGLSDQGKQRAQCLRTVFGASSKYNIGYIMAETPSSDGSHQRPFDTVSPLAADLGITIDTSCDEKDAKCVKKVVDKYKGPGNILICWEHQHLTDLAAKLGDSNAPTYPDDHFDLIWTDPSPYTSITSITSEQCPGLDN